MIDPALDFLGSQTVIDDRYEIERILGTGATGVVVLANDINLDFHLALKLLYPHLSLSKESFGRFLSETRITMQLSHPNILPTYGIGMHDNRFCYLKMDYNDGGSLKELLVNSYPNGLPAQELYEVLFDIAQGLSYAHEHGVVHRDIKPENVLLTNDGLLRIADFGLAQMIKNETNLTGQGTILGTPLYMSPEQIRAEILDSRTDIYTFAMLAYELATGQPPYLGDTFYEVADKHLNSPFPSISALRPDLSTEVIDLLECCATKERSLRCRSFDAVSKELSKFIPDTTKTESITDLRAKYPSDIFVVTDNRRLYWFQRKASTIWWSMFFMIAVGLIVFLAHSNGEAKMRVQGSILWIERKTDVELSYIRKVFPISFKHTTEIHQIVQRISYRELKAALWSGIDPNQRDQEGNHALHIVAKNEGSNRLEYLHQAGVNLNEQDSKGDTALHIAMRANRPKNAKFLIDSGASIFIENHNKETALHLAAKKLPSDLVRKLIAKGADINAQDLEYNTPLHYAVIRGDSNIVKMLIENDADRTKNNSNGETAYSLAQKIAIELQRNEILNILSK